MEPLGELALKRGLITQEHLHECLRIQAEAAAAGTPCRLGQILLQRGFLSSEAIVQLLEEQLGPQFASEAAEPFPVLEEVEGVPTRVGPYVILGEIGHGAVGTVYRAHHPQLKRDVALKVLRRDAARIPGVLDRFMREAHAVAKLSHPHIVPVYDAGHAEGAHYIVMELIRGVPLSQRAGAAVWPVRRRVAVMEKVARAVHHAHQNHIIHRDIKPQNILLDEFDEPHIVDFGMARFDADATINAAGGETREGVAVGTPYYMSPEQVRGEAQIDARSDVYSIGAVLYLLLTGAHPYEGSSIAEIYGKILRGDPASPRRLNPALPDDIETIIVRALAHDRGRRYPTAAELADDLRRWLEAEPVRARPVGRTEKIVRHARRHPIAAGSMLAAAAALALAAVFLVLFAKAREAAHRERVATAETLRRETADRLRLEQQLAVSGALLRLHKEEERQADPDLNRDEQRGRVQATIEELDRIVQARPEHAPARLARGIAFALAGLDADADAEFTAAMELPEARVRRARLGLRRLALLHFMQAAGQEAMVRRIQEDGGPRAAGVWRLIVEGRPKEAAETAQAELARGGGTDELHLATAAALYESGLPGEALACIAAGLRAHPGSDLLHYLRGEIAKARRDFDGAGAAYSAALHANPRLAEARFARGHLAAMRGDPRGAISDFDHALELQPKLADALLGRAETRAKLAKSDPSLWEAVARDLDRALELGGKEWPRRDRALQARETARRAMNP